MDLREFRWMLTPVGFSRLARVDKTELASEVRRPTHTKIVPTKILASERETRNITWNETAKMCGNIGISGIKSPRASYSRLARGSARTARVAAVAHHISGRPPALADASAACASTPCAGGSACCTAQSVPRPAEILYTPASVRTPARRVQFKATVCH